MSELDNLFNEMKDVLPIPYSYSQISFFNPTVILAFKSVAGYQLPSSNGEDVAMEDSTEYEPYFLLQTLHLVPLACLLTALTH